MLTHGAGTNADAPLLVALAEAFGAVGLSVLCYELPFRRARPTGPPSPAGAAADREGLRHAVGSVRARVAGHVYLGGHSYGGRQASILAASEPGLADALLLLAYPLHPPRRPGERRTAHFTELRTPALFVHGSRDPFGSLDELEAARHLVPARTALLAVDGAGHDLRLPGPRGATVAVTIAEAFACFVAPGDGTPGDGA
ncbi:MAG: alpha/beta hydrolase [Candidatus Rokubacteria bacterium]|nr:alpha/beta hydrolase [Candidatus Rokubacteria bacterium]